MRAEPIKIANCVIVAIKYIITTWYLDDWEVQLEDKPVTTDRAGHEISDDYDRETSVIEQVLAAAVKRREEKSKRQGERHYAGQVSRMFTT